MSNNIKICLNNQDIDWLKSGDYWEFIRTGIESCAPYFEQIKVIKE
jgi:hypothetical protein